MNVYNKTVAKGFPVTKLSASCMIGLKLGTGCRIGHGMCDLLLRKHVMRD